MSEPSANDSQRRTNLASLPELRALDASASSLRIPPELDVPLTPRVRRLIDTPAFRRLARVRQLGLVSLVYPAATHSRFEHSLGVYRLALLFLRRLLEDERFVRQIDRSHAELFLVAALFHDLGHWPFCHPIEDMGLAEIPPHESLVVEALDDERTARALREDWAVSPCDLVDLLGARREERPFRILASLLSGPIDIDKLDYLQRDSLHAGVPYGRNFDQGRLIGSLCLNEAGDGLAITEKGKTAAEMMVFARYVMFSEVYWHHGVRAATAMLQRAFFAARSLVDLPALFRAGEREWPEQLRTAIADRPEAALIEGLFGAERRLYKRLAQFSFYESRATYERVARRPYPWLVDCAEELAREIAAATGLEIAPHEVLIDAPPIEKEVEFRIEVRFEKEGRYRLLEEVSPVVRTLAREQFDDYVKRVRVFAAPRIRALDLPSGEIAAFLERAAASAGDGHDGRGRGELPADGSRRGTAWND